MDNNTLEQQIAELKELLDLKNKQLIEKDKKIIELNTTHKNFNTYMNSLSELIKETVNLNHNRYIMTLYYPTLISMNNIISIGMDYYDSLKEEDKNVIYQEYKEYSTEYVYATDINNRKIYLGEYMDTKALRVIDLIKRWLVNSSNSVFEIRTLLQCIPFYFPTLPPTFIVADDEIIF